MGVLASCFYVCTTFQVYTHVLKLQKLVGARNQHTYRKVWLIGACAYIFWRNILLTC